MKTVGVDFNMITSPGVVLASPSFASEQLSIGDVVVAIDFDDSDMRYFAVVQGLDESGVAYLKIEAKIHSSLGGVFSSSPIGGTFIQSRTTGTRVGHYEALTLSVTG